MKKCSLLLCVLLVSTLGACGHFPIINPAITTPVTQSDKFPSELLAFLDEATNAAKLLEKENNVDEWKTEHDKVKKLFDEIPHEGINPSIQKECDDIMDQMLLGNLAIGLKKNDAWVGNKRCQEISAKIMQDIKYIKSMNSKKAAKNY
ncbi:MAG: hypothetical protein ABSG67_22390 [Thermoguttaceae bacterium]|jgi:hypothetical protein